MAEAAEEQKSGPAVGLEAECGRLLLARGLKLAVAESCTGGLLGHRLTEVAGSSAWFVGGILAYDDPVKTGLLGVDPELIATHGAVSAECAGAMARGALQVPGAGITLAITGIAGPTGERPGKPVGTTFIAMATAQHTIVRRHNWQGDRSHNKQSSAAAALDLLQEYLLETSAEC